MSVKKQVYNERGFARQALCSLIGSLWGPVAGAFSGYGSVALPSFEADPDAPFFMSEEEKAFFTSVPFLSAIPGSLLAGLITARLGRKNLLAALLLPLAASWLMIAFGRTFEVFVAARLLMGFCAGVVMPVGQVYLTEIAAPGTRGFIASTTMFFQLFYGWVNYAVGSLVSWKYLAVVNAAIHLAHVPVALFVPESPTWLLTRGEGGVARARRALQFLRGGGGAAAGRDPDAEVEVEAEFALLQELIGRSKTEKGSARDIFRWNYLKPVIVLCVFVGLRQYTGAFAVISYTVDIFKSAGGNLSPNVSTVIVGAVQVAFNILSNSVTDKIGRKRLIVGSGVAMGVSHVVFGTYYYLHTHAVYGPVARRMAWVPLVALIVFSIGFSLGFASALFVLMSELIPLKIKAHAAGVASIVNHVTNFMVVELFFRMKHAMTEAGTFWFYGAVCFLAAAYYAALVPETNGKSLQELEERLTTSKKQRRRQQQQHQQLGQLQHVMAGAPERQPQPQAQLGGACSCASAAAKGGNGLDFDNPSYLCTVAAVPATACSAGAEFCISSRIAREMDEEEEVENAWRGSPA